MRKKDYELIGRRFKDSLGFYESRGEMSSHATLMAFMTILATEFALNDPKFNHKKFLTACGIGYSVKSELEIATKDEQLA